MHRRVISSHGPLNRNHLKRIEETINRSLGEHPRTLAVRADLRLPSQADDLFSDMPTFFADTDPAVITRFFESVNSKVEAAIKRKISEGKRAHPCTVRYVWVREVGQEHNNHYHVLLLFNHDVFYKLGSYEYVPSSPSLSSIIREAWCSALRIDPDRFWTLTHFPNNPTYHLNRNGHPEKYSRIWDELFYRVSYFAKKETKQYGNGCRSFGCSQK